jgi:hypothetical protein
MLLLPWWAETAIHGPPDASLQADIVYSTVCGYYAIRLIDNLMDRHATIELDLLPVLQFLLAEFHGAYQRHFPCDHAFWALFHETWYHSAEVTLRDAAAGAIDCDHFVTVTARKTEAVKIPIAAVCYTSRRAEMIGAWSAFVDRFGCWHQMSNDLFDWRKDLQLGTTTYFLSEARRRSASGEPVMQWVAREGFGWAMGLLDEWMADLTARARALGSRDLLAYLELRDQMMRERAADLAPGLEAAAELYDLLAEGKGEIRRKSE